MPLRDHFRPPVSKRASWEGFHGQWPAMIVQQLNPVLPEGYTAEPRVHLGPYFEIDVTAFERAQPQTATVAAGIGGIATVAWSTTQGPSSGDGLRQLFGGGGRRLGGRRRVGRLHPDRLGLQHRLDALPRARPCGQ